MANIDWESFMNTYNRMHKTSYTSYKQWIEDLYEKHGKYVSPVAKELGVGFGTMNKYLELWGMLERKPKGGARIYDRTTKSQRIFLDMSEETMRELTKDQIAERCGLSSSRIKELLKIHDRKCLNSKEES